MGSTTTNGLPYPVGTDRVMDGDNAIQALAEAIDTKALFTGDTGVITPAAAGFVVVAGQCANLTGNVRRRNGVVAIDFIFNLVNAWGAGDVANTAVITIPAGYLPSVRTSLVCAGNGPGSLYYATATGSSIYLGATMAALAANAQQSVSGVWMI